MFKKRKEYKSIPEREAGRVTLGDLETQVENLGILVHNLKADPKQIDGELIDHLFWALNEGCKMAYYPEMLNVMLSIMSYINMRAIDDPTPENKREVEAILDAVIAAAAPFVGYAEE